ncbi:MAG TPA: peptidase U32 [Desulfobulbaceae bacterium]|nr:peptidase U32 [Desulfobulbaceae bacterium]
MTTSQRGPTSMELLAPVGSFAAFEAALAEGADAVYVGAPALNARALSRDFSFADIQAMVEHAHGAGVRVYIAMNSLIKENELALAVEGLASFAKIRPDALIIQDMGLFFLARSYFPALPLHASTLMSIHNSMGVSRLVELGFKRVVLPRELTIREVSSIYRKTGAELEVFVHGAMCFSYSGLCLFSSLHGGKSSLRGQCVQPCRRRYTWQKKKVRGGPERAGDKDGGYLFSMNDLCGIDLLPQLRKAGVACLKIEGRMKSSQYVRNTVRAYRLLLDSSAAGGEGPDRRLLEEAQKLLDEAMGRRRSPGFFLDRKPPEAVSPNLSGNIGLMAGRIQRLDEVQAKGARRSSLMSVDLRSDLGMGDRLRLHNERSGERTSFTLKSMKLGSRVIQQAKSGQKVTIIVDQLFPGGGKGAFNGSLFKVDVSSRRREDDLARARFVGKRGRAILPDQRKIEQVLRDISFTADPPERHRTGERQRVRPPQWWFKIDSLRDMHCRLPVQPDRYLLAMTPASIESWLQAGTRMRRSRANLVWCLPPVILEEALDWYAHMVYSLAREGCTDFQLGHFSQQILFAGENGRQNFRLYTNYTCNLLNSLAVKVMADMGFAGAQFSLETDLENLTRSLSRWQAFGRSTLVGTDQCAIGIYVFGRPALFTARLDDRRYQYGKRFVSPKGESFILEQGEGMTQARSVLPFSLLEWRKELESLGLAYFLVDLSSGNIKKNVADFTALFSRRGSLPPVLNGNFQGGLV